MSTHVPTPSVGDCRNGDFKDVPPIAGWHIDRLGRLRERARKRGDKEKNEGKTSFHQRDDASDRVRGNARNETKTPRPSFGTRREREQQANHRERR